MFSDIWKISGEYYDPAGFEKEPGSFDFEDAVAKALSPEDPEGFLDLGPHRLCDCFLMPDINAAADRILDAADTGERIAVFGDYDCDGVCATAILYDFLKNTLECNVMWRVPERREGYGLSKKIVDELSGIGVTLIVTVDNGISCADEVDYCESLGIDVVVTDHHEITGPLPKSIANCDPQRDDSEYPAKNICGGVVAYKLCEAISFLIGADGIENYLPLAAVATVGDIMELQGENRSIVTLGLGMIKDTMFPGLNVLIADRIANSKNVQDMTAGVLSYYVVPLLNAAGRMGSAADAVRLLLAENEKEAVPLLQTVLKLSEQRKYEVDKIISTYEASPKSYLINDEKAPFIFVKGDSWPEGLIGVVAGRLCDLYKKNICVLTRDTGSPEDEAVYKASVRGTGIVNVVEVLTPYKHLMVSFGGHKKACGFSVKESNLHKLCECVAGKDSALNDIVPPVNTEKALMYLPPESISIENAEKLEKFEPFGEGCELPVFVTGGIESMEVTKYGDPGKVLKFGFRFRGGYFVSGVNFKDIKYYEMIAGSRPTAVAYTLGVNEFNGKRSVQIQVIDLIEGDKQAAPETTDRSYGNLLENNEKDLFGAFHVSREDLSLIYRTLRSAGSSFSFKDVMNVRREAGRKGGPNAAVFTWFKLKYALEVFVDVGLVERLQAGSYRFVEIKEKRNLSDSGIYKVLEAR